MLAATSINEASHLMRKQIPQKVSIANLSGDLLTSLCRQLIYGDSSRSYMNVVLYFQHFPIKQCSQPTTDTQKARPLS
jgi:hypothetical protein